MSTKGLKIKDWLTENHPNLIAKSVGRVELSKRQDWICEVSAKIWPLFDAILEYLVPTLRDEANILRDSTLMRMETYHFECYIHVCALMWVTVFEELRYLTNSKKFNLNPLELNEIFDALWKVGNKMRGGEAFDLFEEAFRPWPRLRPEDPDIQEWYDAQLERKANDLEMLRSYTEKEDAASYTVILRQVLQVFGKSIQAAFERNWGDYLEATDGNQANSKLTESEKLRVKDMVCHNNHAERTFAVIRSLLQRYPSMSLRTASVCAHARLNRNGRRENGGEHWTYGDSPVLRAAVNELCSVRHKSVGKVTALLRQHHKDDSVAQRENRKRKQDEKLESARRKIRARAAKADAAAETELVTSVESLRLKLLACGEVKKTALALLIDQVNARLCSDREYPLSTIGMEFRNDRGKKKIRSTSKNKGDRAEYLQQLLELMIEHDVKQESVVPVHDMDIVRGLPAISVAHTSARSKDLKQQLKEDVRKECAPVDDPCLVSLRDEYLGKILYVDDDKSWPQQTFRVVDVQFYKGQGRYHDSWEATCEPVEPDGEGGWSVPSKYLVSDTNEKVVLNSALYGIELVSLADPEKPERKCFVDEYIAAHENPK